MRCSGLLSALLVTVFGIAYLQASQEQIRPGTAVKDSPFVGNWIANLPKSKPHPSSQYQSVTLEISVTGDTITMASDIVNANGKLRIAETFRTDGIPTPGTLNPGIV